MKGTRADWENLIRKLNDLEQILEPVKEELKLTKWLPEAKNVFNNLLKTYNRDEINFKQYCRYSWEECNDLTMAGWWSKILSWKEDYGSGTHPHWEGWFTKFLGGKRQPYKADDFPSGLVTVAVNIADTNGSPAVEDKGIFVAGTLGFTVRESQKQRGGHIVEPNQIWNLLMPKCSPVTPRLNVNYTTSSTCEVFDL